MCNVQLLMLMCMCNVRYKLHMCMQTHMCNVHV
jgi:hypothetical protein